jgi:hypothetical protein
MSHVNTLEMPITTDSFSEVQLLLDEGSKYSRGRGSSNMLRTNQLGLKLTQTI